MLKKQLLTIGLGCILVISSPIVTVANQNSATTTTMENCGAYLFEWRPIDCGNGYYFAILVGGNTLHESNVILSRGYDYAYTFDYQVGRPWGQVPTLVNVDGIWAIPENQPSLAEGIQPTMRITLVTNNGYLASRERYIDVVSLPGSINPHDLPPEVRKYLINVDGSDAGAYDGTITAGWDTADGISRYRKPDGTYITNSWLKVDDKEYYMDEEGIMLSDTITSDGYYVNSKGEKTSYIPGWIQVDGLWKYVQKNGYYAASTWVQDIDGKYYYFDMAARMVKDTLTPDGYYVDADGIWNGQPSTINAQTNLGPGDNNVGTESTATEEGWEGADDTWKYRLPDGNYVTSNWKQDTDGKWYYFNEDSLMVRNTTTPDGYYINADGEWDGL